MVPMMISVILPTYNRKGDLFRCLESLRRQSLPADAYEVIVVDDGSTDGTAEAIAPSAGLTVVRQDRRGPGAARNSGAAMAAGAILACIEDDVIAAPDWLEAGLRAFEDPEVAAAEGTTQVEGETLRLFDAPEQLSYVPCNFFVRKDVFKALGGYDEEFFEPGLGLYFREDADFGFRLLEQGRRVVRVPDAVVTHPRQFTDPASPWRHVRRYLFDPLLARKHPRAYRHQIEIKRIAGVRIPRPFHYAALCSLAGWLLLGAGLILSSAAAAIAGGAAVVACLFVVQYRYTHRWIPALTQVARFIAFFSLPFYYCYWHVRGCIRFRYWKSLI
jgi:glycosyltransferase involved in cell wall biosynthesis